MSGTDKAAERSTLILQFGRLLAPIFTLTVKGEPPTANEYRVAAATFRPDLDRWANEVSHFVIVGGYRFSHEYDDILRSPYQMYKELGVLAREASDNLCAAQTQLQNLLQICQITTLNAIDRVPIDWAPKLLEGHTPFTTYLKIRDAIGTARQRIHYFDRYLDADFFPLYLRDVKRSLEIRLVTTQGNQRYGVANVIAISRLASLEFSNYQLIQVDSANMHDRNIRIDDTIFFLGASAKDAGKHPTNFSPTDSTASAHNVLDSILSKGVAVT